MVGMRTETDMGWTPGSGGGSGGGSGDAGGGEGGVRRLDGRGRADDAGHRVEGLQAVAGVDDDGLERGVELAGLDELLEHTDGGAARGLGEDALRAGQQHDALADLVVADVLDRAAGLA